KVYKAWYPLVGFPRFVRLHEAIIVESSDSTYIQFDLLPKDPTSLSSAFRWFTLQPIPGELRMRPLKYRPENMLYVGASDAGLERMRQFVAAYDDNMVLTSNNCKTFADRFIYEH
ncbi:hypothetical protein JKP88DRAFT_154832, partial [Tribonema minus]